LSQIFVVLSRYQSGHIIVSCVYGVEGGLSEKILPSPFDSNLLWKIDSKPLSQTKPKEVCW
jgi:hypothetical protein